MKTKRINKERNSNLEILRIISMILIVMHHYSVHGFSLNNLDYSFNKYIIDFLYLGGKLGVNCFILISGYFMINSKFTIKKLLKLLGEVWFYSIGILILFITILTPIKPLGIGSIIKSFLPVTYSLYWFITVYVILMVLSPFINKFVDSIDKTTYQKLIVFLVIIGSIIPSLMLGYSKIINELGWFIILYLIAGYIKKYTDSTKMNANKHFIVAGISIFILLLSVICFNLLGYKFGIKGLINNSRYFANFNSIILLIISIELLIGFSRLKERRSRFINTISSATLGVYLIHDNFLVRPYIWRKVFKNELVYDSKYLIFHAVFAVITVYVICTIIDLIRQKTVEKLYLSFIDRYFDSISNKIRKKLYIFKKYITNILHKYYD